MQTLVETVNNVVILNKIWFLRSQITSGIFLFITINYYSKWFWGIWCNSIWWYLMWCICCHGVDLISYIHHYILFHAWLRWLLSASVCVCADPEPSPGTWTLHSPLRCVTKYVPYCWSVCLYIYLFYAARSHACKMRLWGYLRSPQQPHPLKNWRDSAHWTKPNLGKKSKLWNIDLRIKLIYCIWRTDISTTFMNLVHIGESMDYLNNKYACLMPYDCYSFFMTDFE